MSMQPNSVRGQYVKSVSISATMTPGVMIAA
jgi:ribosomal protein L1